MFRRILHFRTHAALGINTSSLDPHSNMPSRASSLFGQPFDPFAVAAFCLGAIVLVVFFMIIGCVARKSANQAWDAVKVRPKEMHKPILPLPRAATLPISQRKSVSSMTILESIPEGEAIEDFSSPPSSLALHDEGNYIASLDDAEVEGGDNVRQPASRLSSLSNFNIFGKQSRASMG